MLGSLDLAILLPAVKTDFNITVSDQLNGAFVYSRGQISVTEVIQFPIDVTRFGNRSPTGPTKKTVTDPLAESNAKLLGVSEAMHGQERR